MLSGACAVAGRVAAAAFLSMAIASADEELLVPDTFSLQHSTQVTGDPPYSPEVVTGPESWSIFDLATNKVIYPDLLSGVDTLTISGSFTNNDFSDGFDLVDLTDFGGGWENEWFDNVYGGLNGDLMVTPFGNFELFGPADLFTNF